MQRNTTLNLPDQLLQKARAYAAAQGTTMTAIIRSHLEAITSEGGTRPDTDPLLAYSEGRLSRREAIRLLGLRDYAELLVLLGDADLLLPRQPAHEIDNQAVLFEKLWRQA